MQQGERERQRESKEEGICQNSINTCMDPAADASAQSENFPQAGWVTGRPRVRVSRASEWVQGLYKGQPNANDTLRWSRRLRNEREVVKKGRERRGWKGHIKTVFVCTGTYIHRKKTDRIWEGEFNGEWKMETEEGEGTVQELTCPLKFSSVFAREQQPKNEGQSRCCSHVVQHLWRPTGKRDSWGRRLGVVQKVVVVV